MDPDVQIRIDFGEILVQSLPLRHANLMEKILLASLDKNSLWGGSNMQKRQLCVKEMLALVALHNIHLYTISLDTQLPSQYTHTA